MASAPEKIQDPSAHGIPAMAILLVLGSTMALAFKGIFVKLAYGAGISIMGVLIWRFGMAVPLYWAGAVMMGAMKDKTARRDILVSITTGPVFLTATICDFYAIDLLGAALSRMVLFTFPAIVLLLQSCIDRRLPPRRQIIAFIVTYGGLWVMVSPDTGGVALPVEGIFWALGSAASYGTFLVMVGGMTKRMGSVRFTTWSNTGTGLVMAIYALAAADISDVTITMEGFVYMAIIAVFCTVLPIFALYEGISRIGPALAALMNLSGPAITVIGAWLILDEILTPQQVAGAAIVCTGVLILQGKGIKFPRFLRPRP